jgi:hypothetical protein
MDIRIIYPNENGLAIVYPTDALPLTEVARKDVPAGVPYLFVNVNDFPDEEFIDAWEADFSNPDGYGIGTEAWFAERGVQI